MSRLTFLVPLAFSVTVGACGAELAEAKEDVGPIAKGVGDKESANAGRLLSADFQSMTGFFRDDGPLCDLILDDAGRRELDQLWQEFDVSSGDEKRKLCSLHLSLMDLMGVKLPRFGDADARLEGI